MKTEKFYCRFCNKKSALSFHAYTDRDVNEYQVICPECGCHSPVRSTAIGSIKAWNLMHMSKPDYCRSN